MSNDRKSRTPTPPDSGKGSGESLGRFGQYNILSKIGQGGMGTVYHAIQVSLNRPVALKLLPASMATDESYVKRFQREARAAAQLNHPNLIQVFDAGEQDGMNYFAMEFVDGQSLAQKVERDGPLSESSALAAAMCVANALQYAWVKAKLIHRDIKPENLMLTRDGIVKVCDLGLAKSLDKDSLLTVAGMAMGTPHFIAPELARGESNIDTRADIYSLGVTLFFLVTRKPPFQTGSTMAIMQQHCEEPLPDPRESNPHLSDGFIQVLNKMTAKKREDRYQDMAELYADLDRARQHCVPVAAKAAAAKAESGSWASVSGNWKLLGALVALVIVLGVVLAGVMAYQRRKPAPAATRAESVTGNSNLFTPKHLSELFKTLRNGDSLELGEGFYLLGSVPDKLKDIHLFAKPGTLPALVLHPHQNRFALGEGNGTWRFNNLTFFTRQRKEEDPTLAAMKLGPKAHAEFEHCLFWVFRTPDSTLPPPISCGPASELVLRNSAVWTGSGIELSTPHRIEVDHCTCFGGSLFQLEPTTAPAACPVQLSNNLILLEWKDGQGLIANSSKKSPLTPAESSKQLDLHEAHNNVIASKNQSFITSWKSDPANFPLARNTLVNPDVPLHGFSLPNCLKWDFRIQPDNLAAHEADNGMAAGVIWPTTVHDAIVELHSTITKQTPEHVRETGGNTPNPEISQTIEWGGGR